MATLLVLAFETRAELMVEAGTVPLFARCLADDASETVVTRSAGAALVRLCALPEGLEKVTEATGLLVEQAKSGSTSVQEQSTAVLLAVAEETAGQKAICEAGAAEMFVQRAVGTNVATKRAATGILCRLAKRKDYVPTLIAAGAASALVDQLRDGTQDDQEAAAAALQQLTSEQRETPREDGAAPSSGMARPETAGLVATVEAGGISPLVRALMQGGPSTRTYAMASLHNLAKSMATRQSVAADVEIVPACVRAMQPTRTVEPHPARDLREQAAATLAALSEAGKRADIVKEGGVEGLMALLQGASAVSTKLQAVRALCSISDHADSHPLMGEAGLEPLYELAGAGGGAQIYAASTLHKLSAGGHPTVVAMLASSDAAMSLFVSQLGGNLAEQRAAVTSVRHLCARPEAQQAIINSGGVASLVAVANNPDVDIAAKKVAAFALAGLAAPPHSEIVAACGGTAVLVEALKLTGADPSQAAAALTHVCVAALEQLVEHPAGRRAMLASGVPPAVELLENKSKTVQAHALSVLLALVSDEEGQVAVGSAGAAPALVRLADNASAATSASVSSILCSLAKQRSEVPALIAARAATPLVALLRDGTAEDQEMAAEALQILTTDFRAEGAEDSPREGGRSAGQTSVVKAGGVAPLVTVVRGGSTRAQVHAMCSMHNLARCAESRSAVAANADAIGACVLMLTCSNEIGVKEHAAAALACLADGGRRPDIVEAGGVPGLMALLQGGPDSVTTQQAARAICSLAEHLESHPVMAAAGLGALVVLAGGTGKAQEYAAATLHKLSAGGNTDALSVLATSGAGVALLVRQLTGSVEEQRTAVSSLRHLTSSAEARKAIVECGGAPALVAVAQATKIGKDSRKEATFTLAALATEPNCEAVAQAGAVEVLVDALQHGGAELTAAAAAALEELVVSASGEKAILSGGMTPCVKALNNKNEAVKLHALSVLQRLARSSEGQAAIGAANGARPLVLLTETNSAAAKAGASSILCNLARSKCEIPALIAARAAPPYVAQVLGGTDDEQAAAEALQAFTGDLYQAEEKDESGSPSKLKSTRLLAAFAPTGTDGLVAAAQAGAVAALVQLLLRKPGSAAAQVPAVHTLYNLASCGTTLPNVAVDEDAFGACIEMLRSSDVSKVKKQAAAVLSALCGAGRRADIIRAGGVAPLMEMIDNHTDKSSSTRLQAVKALCTLADDAASHAQMAVAGLGAARRANELERQDAGVCRLGTQQAVEWRQRGRGRRALDVGRRGEAAREAPLGHRQAAERRGRQPAPPRAAAARPGHDRRDGWRRDPRRAGNSAHPRRVDGARAAAGVPLVGRPCGAEAHREGHRVGRRRRAYVGARCARGGATDGGRGQRARAAGALTRRRGRDPHERSGALRRVAGGAERGGSLARPQRAAGPRGWPGGPAGRRRRERSAGAGAARRQRDGGGAHPLPRGAAAGAAAGARRRGCRSATRGDGARW